MQANSSFTKVSRWQSCQPVVMFISFKEEAAQCRSGASYKPKNHDSTFVL